MQRLVLIRGLGHSGTTLLEVLLSRHPGFIGLGEAFRTLRGVSDEKKLPSIIRTEQRKDMICTCGNVVPKCPVWGPISQFLSNNDNDQLLEIEKIKYFLNHIKNIYDINRIIIDSSQSDLDVNLLSNLGKVYDVKVVFVVRDVRSWVFSRLRKKDGSALRHIISWYRGNRRVEKALITSGLPYFLLGYEELSLSPETSVRSLVSWIGVNDDIQLNPGTSHLSVGNRMRLKATQDFRVQYDAAWLSDLSLDIFSSISFSFIEKDNRRLVYSNNFFLDKDKGK